MVINQSAEVKKKCNLIVAPIALLSQWKDEIETKSVDLEDPETPALSVYIYHGPKKTKSKRELKGYDVILTSYGTLVAEFPKPKKNKGKKKVNSDGELESDDAVVHVKDVYGPLVQIEWYVHQPLAVTLSVVPDVAHDRSLLQVPHHPRRSAADPKQEHTRVKVHRRTRVRLQVVSDRHANHEHVRLSRVRRGRPRA